MANSKSNIYPIQLQNAELNLNKYDAEIKQYTGFNKNNAPFVGGCLSNLFTKDTTIEGADGQNVYIAPNGDIYEAKTDGLYKNEEKLIDTTGKTFLEREVIPTTPDVVKVFHDKIKIVRKRGTFENVEGTKFILELDGSIEADNTIVFIPDSFNYTEEQMDFVINNNIYAISFNLGAKCFEVVAGVYHNALNKLRVFIINMDTLEVADTKEVTIPAGVDIQSPIAIQYYTDGNYFQQLSFFYTTISSSTYTQYATFYNFDYDTETITLAADNQTTLPAPSLSNRKLLSNKITDYKVNSYPLNTAIIKNLPESEISDSSNFYVFNAFRDIRYANSTISYSGSRIDTYKYNNIKGKDTENLGQEDNLKAGILTPLIGIYDYQVALYSASYGDSTLCFNSLGLREGFSFTDAQTLNATPKTFSKGNYRLGTSVNLGNFKLLFNNNNFSAIAGQNVLLTDWNVIDLFTLGYFRDTRTDTTKECVYYKYNDKWYVIKKGKPTLSKFLDQLVINADSIRNSFDIKRNKVLFFAPNFNGVYIDRSQSAVYPYSGLTNDFYIAASVNEYAQENNSSLLLNPIAVYHTDTSSFKRHLEWFKSPFNYAINIYTNINNANEIIYLGTLNSIYNNKLDGLPYPTDTNGNVTYCPCLFSKIISTYGNMALIKTGDNSYPLIVGNMSLPIMSYYLASGIENFDEAFIIQGQYYGIINNQIFAIQFMNGVVASQTSVVSTIGLQFCGNTPYEALFFSKTNRCLYSFNGANVLNPKQLVDKITEIRDYKYNPATQSIFLVTNIGVIVSSLFGIYQIELLNVDKIYLLNDGIVISDNSEIFRYIKYYNENTDGTYTKQNIELETCFYGSNNTLVTINDCLYFRLFSEEAESGEVEVSATTLNNKGRITEKTVYKIKASDWDPVTKTVYYRYQPKEQRGLGISFKITSPFKIAALSIGTQADAILIDKVSKGAINAPERTSSITEW